MKESPQYKRFKHINITGDTLSLSDTRSLIIRNLQRCNHYQNTDNLKRLEKEAQNIEIDTSKTDKMPSVYDRAILALSYADTVIFTGHILRPGNQKVKTVHLIIEMEEHFLGFYSYVTKYHKLSSMNIPGYQCSNVYINVEKVALMNKDIQ